MDEIKNIINNVFVQLSQHQPNKDNELFELWEKLLNENEKTHVKLSGLKDGALYVNVDSSAWLYQMKLKRTPMLAALQKNFPGIQKIYIKIGPIT